jgi:hypothetical protein
MTHAGRSMTQRATIAVRILGVVACALVAGGCGGHSSNTSGPTPSQNSLLAELNADANDGRTARWASLPIPVFLNGIAQADEVSAWSAATGGAVTFMFVNSQPATGISFHFGGGTDECGSTVVDYDASGQISGADVQVVQAIYRGPQCQRTVVHETGHAIGFLAHTADGGLMDPDGGNGVITQEDVTFIRALYSIPPGSSVGLGEGMRLPSGRTGRRSVTIVDPVRR